ncbi:hypothetical protein PBRA_009157 [Plasmodiophora brassicae]|uniref:Uncharacterized protein n=1 Tax=Plasmodiophora brassicae TaxID=37360 RepID=A0A0G4J4L0_PLABS|nr:hypothetical protein PBRA_009157 [Plasmodiophora brassicae]
MPHGVAADCSTGAADNMRPPRAALATLLALIIITIMLAADVGCAKNFTGSTTPGRGRQPDSSRAPPRARPPMYAPVPLSRLRRVSAVLFVDSRSVPRAGEFDS